LLVAQCLLEGMTLVTQDEMQDSYGISGIKARACRRRNIATTIRERAAFPDDRG